MPLAYMRDYPKVTINLFLTDRLSTWSARRWRSRLVSAFSASELIARPLAPYRLTACASPGYLGEHGTSVTLEDVKAYRCLSYAHCTRPIDEERLFTRGG